MKNEKSPEPESRACTSEATQESGYWTPERMAQAKPLPVPEPTMVPMDEEENKSTVRVVRPNCQEPDVEEIPGES